MTKQGIVLKITGLEDKSEIEMMGGRRVKIKVVNQPSGLPVVKELEEYPEIEITMGDIEKMIFDVMMRDMRIGDNLLKKMKRTRGFQL